MSYSYSRNLGNAFSDTTLNSGLQRSLERENARLRALENTANSMASKRAKKNPKARVNSPETLQRNRAKQLRIIEDMERRIEKAWEKMDRLRMEEEKLCSRVYGGNAHSVNSNANSTNFAVSENHHEAYRNCVRQRHKLDRRMAVRDGAVRKMVRKRLM